MYNCVSLLNKAKNVGNAFAFTRLFNAVIEVNLSTGLSHCLKERYYDKRVD